MKFGRSKKCERSFGNLQGYQRISTTDILETCDTKRLMWQRTCVTLNVTLNALNVQSTDSKFHDICREFWTREQGKHTKEFSVLGLNAFNDIARRLEMCLPVYESRAHKIPHGLCFFIWAFLIFFGNSKTFFETKHHWTLKVVQTHIFFVELQSKKAERCVGAHYRTVYMCVHSDAV